jgi:Uma2 family endonuclease
MSAANQLPHLMSADQFLDWRTPDGTDRWELVDGIPRAMAPPSDRHALIHGEVLRLVGNHLAEQRPDCRIGIGSGLRPNDYTVRIPDLAVAYGPDNSLQAPVLVIEVLSPSNAADTWANVAMYQAVPSVQEILVLETDEIAATVLRRAATVPWPQQTLSRRDDTVTLESIGFSGSLAAFYRTAA